MKKKTAMVQRVRGVDEGVRGVGRGRAGELEARGLLLTFEEYV